MKKRMLSAIVALIIIVPFLVIGGYPFAFIVSVLGILSYKEVLDLKKSHGTIPVIVKVLGLISLIYLIVGEYGVSNFPNSISYPRILLPLLLMLMPAVFYKKNEYCTKDAFCLLGLIYLIGLVFNLIIILREYNIYLLLYLLSITILTDTFAYLIGMLIGKHKMSPNISPNKTWEGALGGAVGGSAIAMIIYSNLVDAFSFKLLIVTFLLTIIAQIGDLVFSKIKRENDIKDFSNIMPGHGGILDRIDSLTFVVLAYTIIIYFI